MDIFKSAITQGVGAVMTNCFRQLRRLSIGNRQLIRQVDFSETGIVLADMALDILDEDGSQFAILSAALDVTIMPGSLSWKMGWQMTILMPNWSAARFMAIMAPPLPGQLSYCRICRDKIKRSPLYEPYTQTLSFYETCWIYFKSQTGTDRRV